MNLPTVPYQKLDLTLGYPELIELEVQQGHINLLRNLRFDYINSDDYFSGIEIQVDSKRPYGNEMFMYDVADAFGWNTPDPENDHLSWHPIAEQVHRQMTYVINILTYNLNIEPGIYVRDRYKTHVWNKKESK